MCKLCIIEFLAASAQCQQEKVHGLRKDDLDDTSFIAGLLYVGRRQAVAPCIDAPRCSFSIGAPGTE